MRVVLAVLGAFLAAACTTVTMYQPDLADKPTARVRFTTSFGFSFVAFLPEGCFGKSDYAFWKHAQRIGMVGIAAMDWARQKPHSIGMPFPPDNPNLTYYEQAVPAGQPLSLGGTFSSYGYLTLTCSAGITFTPEAGEDYEVMLGNQGRQCGISVQRVIGEMAQVKHLPVPGAKPAPVCPPGM